MSWKVVIARAMPHACLMACALAALRAHGQWPFLEDRDVALTQARQQIRDGAAAAGMPRLLQDANHGSATAMRQLGVIYRDGLLQHRADADWGLQWFQRAAVAGDAAADSLAGDVYAARPEFRGKTLARQWYSRASAAGDARGTVALATLYCEGSGVLRSLSRCGALLEKAATELKPTDLPDTKPLLAAAMFRLGQAYGSGPLKDAEQERRWYAAAAAQGRPTAAAAESLLYLKAFAQPEPARATSVLDEFLAHYSSTPQAGDADALAASYASIGSLYEREPGKTKEAIPLYLHASKLGEPDPLIRLAERFTRGEGVAKDLPLSRDLLSSVEYCGAKPDARVRYVTAVEEFNEAAGKRSSSIGSTGVAGMMNRPAGRPGQLAPIALKGCSIVLPAEAATDVVTPAAVVPRYPNVLAPPSVAPGGVFPLLVSLNAQQLDGGTAIVSGEAKDGQLQVTLPQGIDSILIEVNVVAPSMTSTDGVLTKTIELTRDKDSTTATFLLKAGMAAGTAPIFVTLNYNGSFLAMLRRNVQVATQPGTVTPQQIHAVAPVPPPDSRSAPPSPASLPLANGAPPVHLPVEARAPDMTIQEIDDGSQLIYTVSSPLIPGFQKTVAPGAAARQRAIAKLYHDLETQGAQLQMQPGARSARVSRAFAEGQGALLFDQMAPQAFKKTYGQLLKLGAPPHTIQVLTDEPALPWELMRPVGADGEREEFLGLTTSIVHSVATSAPRIPPPADENIAGITAIAPEYKGDLALPSTAKELAGIRQSFPALESVAGNVDAVTALAGNPPDGIVHFAGHGVRVVSRGLPPDVGMQLPDGNIVPATWMNLAERRPEAHPFYFFNACDLGRSDQVLGYVDGWAPRLMQTGASGYLGALWKVSDVTATSFSVHFYSALRQRLESQTGWSVADLVTEARRQTYAESADPTALAYVLYAAPYLTMSATHLVPSAPAAPPPPAAAPGVSQ